MTTIDLAPVTVIGLGPMGQAMVNVLLKAGHPVTVWNRTPSRADQLVEAGAKRAATPAEAVAASDLTILSLTDYQAMYDIFGPTPEGLAGKVLVNLSSDTPEASREAAAWAAERGAAFVTGGIMVPAPAVGTESSYVFYSGEQEAFERFEPVLKLIGAPRYLGTDPGLAQLLYQANLDIVLNTLLSLLHATALVTAAGVPAGEFVPSALEIIAATPGIVGDAAELARRLEAGDHPGHLSTTTMMGATADHILRTSRSLGVNEDLPEVLKAHYDRAIAAGHGADNWTALYEVIKAR